MFKRLSLLAAASAVAVLSLLAPAHADTWTFDVVAEDYHFNNLPERVPAGVLKFNFSNASEKRMHEIVILKHLTGKSTQRVLEIAMTDESKARKLVKFKGASFAKPGKDGDSFKSYFGPGRYFALCFFSNSRNSAPHFTKGMLHEFKVTK